MQRDIIARAGLAGCLAIAAVVAACSSDPFSATGSSLPAEVTQDSVAVQAAPIYPVDTRVVTPDLGESFDERDLLYVGRRQRDALHDRSEWTFTPLINIDFSRNTGDTLTNDLSDWKDIWLELPRDPGSGERSGSRHFSISTLVDTATVASLSTPLGSLIASTFADSATLGNVDDENPAGFQLFFVRNALPADTSGTAFQEVADWFRTGATVGFAIQDESDGLAAEFVSSVDQLAMTGTRAPRLKIRFKPGDLDDRTAIFPVSYGFTHYVREDPPAERLHVGTHLPSRVWFQFDLGATEVPGNATVNRATLRLRSDLEYSFGEFLATLRAYETDLVDVETIELRSALPTRRGAQNFVATEDDSLALDLTDYFQRFVNGVIPGDRGIMLALSTPGELNDLVDLQLFSSAASDSAFRPQLDVIYTPPADFLEKR